jgi:hypothetical protein
MDECMKIGRLATVALLGSALAGPAHAGGASTPDLSGVWARTTFGFEMPESGVGPVRNLARRPNGSANSGMNVGDYNNPILRPETAAIVKKEGEMARAGLDIPNPSNQCRPMPPPYVLRVLDMELLQAKNRVTILYMQDGQFRQVRLNGSHPAHAAPTPHGDSIGHYEGDTLVVDTVGIAMGPAAIIDLYGTPHSDALHVIERYRLIDGQAAIAALARNEKEYGRPTTAPTNVDESYKGKGLQVVFTVEDEKTFTWPWSSSVTYRRSTGHWEEIVCAENTNEYYGGTTTKVPEADSPDF